MKRNALAIRALAIATPFAIAACDVAIEGSLDEDTEIPVEAAAPAPAADYSSPEATVRTLIKACAEKDKAAVAACFSKAGEGEFRPIIEQTASDEMWTEFFELFNGAAVTGSDGDKVDVKLSKRDEQINVAKEGGDWKVMGF
jgi:NAD(P)-dependent dehydrogenase (short-subunit alcohol dehydrogenase family)